MKAMRAPFSAMEAVTNALEAMKPPTNPTEALTSALEPFARRRR